VANVLEGIVWQALQRTIAAGERRGAGNTSAARLAVGLLSALCEELLVHVKEQAKGKDAAAAFVADVRQALACARWSSIRLR
jgi:hypothetical protein